MEKSKRRKKGSKKKFFNNSFKNFSETRIIYENTFVNPVELPRQEFNNASVYNQGYNAYSWYQPRNYAGNYANNYSGNYVSSYSGSRSSSGKPRKKSRRKDPSRSPSPVLGSEEYMVKKIQKTSAIIMKQLLNPNEQTKDDSEKHMSNKNKKNHSSSICNKNVRNLEKPTERDSNKNKNKKVTAYNIQEIHKKIMNHISNLNDGKKKNLINSNSSGYDAVIQHIQKQKRLEISRALRNVCSQSKQTQESTDFINSIIPDIGIKIEDLPRDLIEQLTDTLNYDFEYYSCEEEFSTDGSIKENTLINRNNAENVKYYVKNDSFEGEEPNTEKSDGRDKPTSFPQITANASIHEDELTKNVSANGDESNENHVRTDSLEDESYTAAYIKPEITDDVDSFLPINNNEATNTTINNENYISNNNFEGEQQHPETYTQPEVTDESLPFLQFSSEYNINENKLIKNFNRNDGESDENHVITIKKEDLEIENECIETEHLNETMNLNQTTDHQEKSITNYNIELQIHDNSLSTIAKEIHAEITVDGAENVHVVTIKKEALEIENECVETEHLNETTNLNQTSDQQEKSIRNYNLEFQIQDNSLSTITKEIRAEIIVDGTEKVQNNINNGLGRCLNQEGISSSTLQNLNVSTQTEETTCIDSLEVFVEQFVANNIKRPPENISEAINGMIKIDECILKLTEYRQSLFTNFETVNTCSNSKKSPEKKSLTSAHTIGSKRNKKTNRNRQKSSSRSERSFTLKRKTNILKNSSNKKRKLESTIEKGNANACETNTSVQINNVEDINFLGCKTVFNELTLESTPEEKKNAREANTIVQINNLEDINFCETVFNEITQQNLLEFQEVQEKILIIKVVEDKLVAATESGKIFFCSLEDGHYTKVLVVSKLPLTALLFARINKEEIQMYVGSFEPILKIYNFHSQKLLKSINLDDSIQCMESSWGYIFIGCSRGFMLRYSLKKQIIEYEDKFCDDGVLVLKATQEGARRILLIGSRNSPVYIRDAMTGLYMRRMEDTTIFPTVHSLIIEKNLVYCGTTTHDILVYSFHDGKLIHTHKAPHTFGISCMKIVMNLLFACCHNGSIYVYDINKNTCIDSIKGPGGVILSMEVLENQVIVGTSSFKFKSVPIPHHILKLKH